ncbi:MAG: cytochrome c [Cyclobacteriaceae bacterium]|nr:cytochrome c [Cyclobacteriaceae bacterium]MCB0499059.1 cytochrome c [Cyclobacteriaceae bacterium]MCB9238335.1 cytochrome c [Flammeovirgaceae bacterium]MCO5272017.1 cytochrome c [Cyclobacteriaceae bacterium]MCW5902947.1 cytochrome c [Cyclobacteriaceae bacterium]
MFNLHKNHKNLVVISFVVFVLLSLFVSVMPAYQMQEVAPLPGQPQPTASELNGLHIYISEGCVACHTQQVRNIEMDKMWGDRPSIPSDYYYSKKRMGLWRQSPSLLGSERTGPDLTNVGVRQPAVQWHLLHLYNPRSVVAESVMPAYPWLFEEKENPSEKDVVVPVPPQFLKSEKAKVVATQEALDLAAYLQSLKQAPLPVGGSPGFIPSSRKKETAQSVEKTMLPDGEQLYMQTCVACHQANGQGLAGAFPPLAGSKIVNDDNPELMVQIILQGYDAREEYAVMVGFADQLTDEEIVAIANHERTSWGNNARLITVEEVAKIRTYTLSLNQ